MCSRLDSEKKKLTQQKEQLLKESKTKHTTMDSIKSQIDMLMKVSGRNDPSVP